MLKIILPSQARPNKSKPKVKCSMGERPLDSKTRGPAYSLLLCDLVPFICCHGGDVQ